MIGSRWRLTRGKATALAGMLLILSGGAVLLALQRATTKTLPDAPGRPLLPAPRGVPPPTIRSITIAGNRAEAGEDLKIAADVAPSPLAGAALTYQWSAPVGDFSGDGPVVTWRVPPGVGGTPMDVFPKLVVVERSPNFEASFPPTYAERRVAADVPGFHLNDSKAELTRMAHAFLVDYFGHSDVSPEATLVDFTDQCKGKADELEDVQANRRQFVIESAEASVDHIDYNPPRSYAEVHGPCRFRDHDKRNGKEGLTVGDCILTAVYITNRWWLCESHLRGKYTEVGDNLPPSVQMLSMIGLQMPPAKGTEVALAKQPPSP